jgi:hypothetical protein
MMVLLARVIFNVWLRLNVRAYRLEYYGWGGGAWTGKR